MASTLHFATAVMTPLVASYIGVASAAAVTIWSVPPTSAVANATFCIVYGAQCFGYFLLALFGLGWLMKLGHG